AGEIGATVLGLSDIGVRALAGYPELPDYRLDDLPVIASFIREDPARGTRYATELYQMRKEVERLYRTIMALAQEGNREKAEALRDENLEKLRMLGILRGTTEAISGYRRQMDEIMRDPGMTGHEKRLKLDELQ